MVCVSAPIIAADVAAANAGLVTAATAASVAGAASTAASVIGTVGTIASIAGTLTSVIGQRNQASAAANSANYNATVAQQNAAIAKQNAEWVGQAGEQQVAIQQQKTRSEVGAAIANQAAAGVDVNSGSSVDVRSSAAELGQLNALTIRSNAAKQVYGYKNEEASYNAQAGLDRSEAKNDKLSGEIESDATLLSGFGNTAMNNFQTKNATFIG